MVSVNEPTDWSMRSGTKSNYSVYCLFPLVKGMVSLSEATDWSMRSGSQSQYSVYYLFLLIKDMILVNEAIDWSLRSGTLVLVFCILSISVDKDIV